MGIKVYGVEQKEKMKERRYMYRAEVGSLNKPVIFKGNNLKELID